MLPSRHKSIAYIAPLDGIRAIAIIAVLIYHVYPAVLPGGFTGVDVFYVISGFLITRIVVEDLQANRFSLGEFYLRRIQRLLPNAVLTIGVTVAVWKLLMLPSQATQAARHGLWALFNGSNIYTWLNLGDYWSDTAEWAPLTHTWSLGVEEQFYLLYPGLLLLLVRHHPRRLRVWLIAAAAGSVIACGLVTLSNPTAAFYLLPTRFWELLIGCVLALPRAANLAGAEPATEPVASRSSNYYAFAGIALVAAGFWAIDNDRTFPGLVALVPTVGTGLLVFSILQGSSRVARWLAAPFLVYIGKLSYSLYLWHWPAITLGKYLAHVHGVSALNGAVAGAAAGIGLAWLAYVLVEQPLRNRGAGRGWRLAFIATGFAGAIVLAGSVSIRFVGSGVAQNFERPSFHGKIYDSDLRTDGNPTAAIRYADVHFPPFEPRHDALWKTGGFVRLYGAARPQVVVLGSSHALMYSRLIDDICRENSLSVAFLAAGGRSLFLDDVGIDTAPGGVEADPFDRARRQFLRSWRPEAIIAIDRWDARFEPPRGFEGRLRAFVAELCPLAERIIFVAQVPVAELGERENLREVIADRMRSTSGVLLPRLRHDPNEPLRQQAVNIAEAMTREFPCLRVLRVDRLFHHRDGSLRYAEGRHFYYADDDHLSDLGSEETRVLFTNAIREAHAARASAK